MISSPSVATTGSSLYMHLPATHSSSYIGGAQESTVWYARGVQTMCVSAETSAACDQASSGVP